MKSPSQPKQARFFEFLLFEVWENERDAVRFDEVSMSVVTILVCPL